MYPNFIYDLNSIRDPKNPYTYNRANKIFKKNNFNCHRDGLAFLNVTNNSSNLIEREEASVARSAITTSLDTGSKRGIVFVTASI